MLELLLAALLQFNSIFVGVDAAATETGGTGWGEGQTTTTTPTTPTTPPTSADTGGTGWGEGQVTTTTSFGTGGTGWGEGQ